jgi:hypothetical protein
MCISFLILILISVACASFLACTPTLFMPMIRLQCVYMHAQAKEHCVKYSDVLPVGSAALTHILVKFAVDSLLAHGYTNNDNLFFKHKL